MLRLAFDFIITWRETRTRPNAYTENKKRRKNGRQTCKLAKLAASPHTHVRVHYNATK